MAPGNLPELCRQHQVTYVVHTTDTDADVIRKSPVFQAACRILPIELKTSEDREYLEESNPIITHLRFWTLEVAEAQRQQEWVCVIHPDIFFSKGFLLNVAGLFERGATACYYLYLRATHETFIECLDGPSTGNPSVEISMTAGDLLALLIRHLHPWSASYIASSPHFCFHAEYLLYAVPRTGFHMRVPSTHVLALDPSKINLDSNFSPTGSCEDGQIGTIDHSRDVLAVSLCPLFHGVEMYFQKSRAAPDQIGGWWKQFYTEVQDPLSGRKFTVAPACCGKERTRPMECASDFLINQSAIARNSHQIWSHLNRLNYHQAAKVLAVAFFCARLRRKWHWRGPISILAPEDAAFEKLGTDILNSFLKEGSEDRLLGLIHNHIFPLSLSDSHLKSAKIESLAGHRMEVLREGDRLTVNGARVHGHHVTVAGRIEIHGIGELLLPEQARHKPFTLHGGNQLPTPIFPATLTGRASARSFGNGPAGMVLHERLGAEFQEMNARQLYERGMRLRMISTTRDVLRHYATEMQLDAGELEPLGWIESKIGNRELLEEARACFDQSLRTGPAFAQTYFALGEMWLEQGEAEPAFRYFEQAIAATPIPPDPKPGPGRPDLQLQASAEGATIYGKLLAERGHVRESEALLVAARERTDIQLQFSAEGAILYSEALTKHGYVKEGKELFAAASHLKRLKEYAEHDVHVHARAAYHCGLFCESDNRLQEAIDYYDQAVDLGIQFYEAHRRLGICLRKTGQIQRASEQLDRAMAYRSLHPKLPKLDVRFLDELQTECHESGHSI